ncbi:hypothetical protein RND71_014677 [Anisodus tanguticus]|uniref:Defensin-like domain-containing protein n=1 Tax=Anisodus tanguticus TaxID=243964 RepID=A0AAE1SC63_9SOLA|nr:hypothetical protein RND71_014677 [Anisodus tanguticus]
MEFSKFLIVFLLLVVPFSTASNTLGASNDNQIRPFCWKSCTPDFTQEDCVFECKGRGFSSGNCELGRCCCRE